MNSTEFLWLGLLIAAVAGMFIIWIALRSRAAQSATLQSSLVGLLLDAERRGYVTLARNGDGKVIGGQLVNRDGPEMDLINTGVVAALRQTEQ